MKLVCGLGNPGTRYARTRHNAGFMAVEAFGEPLSASWSERWQARTAKVPYRGQDVLLVEPLTYMNLSGHAVCAAARFFRIESLDVLVVHDDVDLPLGRIQLKMGGGDGGHNGIRSVIEQLGTRDFPRLRIGVGRPDPGDPEMVDHVLSPFSAGEVVVLDASLKRAVEGIQEWVVGGVPMAQNRVNRKERPVKPSCPEGAAPDGPRDQKKEG